MTGRLSQTRLAAWLHGVSVDPDSQDLDANFERMDAIVGALSSGNVLDVLAYAYQLPSMGAHGFDVVQTAITKELEPGWQATSSDALPRRLAAAALADLLDQQSTDAAAIAGLAIGSAEFCDYAPPLTDLPPLAAAAVARIANARRRRSGQLSPPVYGEVESQISKATVEEADPVGSAPLRAALEKVRAAVRRTARGVDSMQAQLEHRNLVIDEELDVLWWCLSKRSETLGQSWRETADAAVLVGSYELAGRLSIQPPPQSAVYLVSAVLEMADLDPEGAISISEAVEASGAIGPAILERGGAQRLFPIISAIAERHRKNDDRVWADGFKAEFGLDPSDERSRQDLVRQFLTELSLSDLLRRNTNES